jgi:hypothetical protein
MIGFQGGAAEYGLASVGPGQQRQEFAADVECLGLERIDPGNSSLLR